MLIDSAARSRTALTLTIVLLTLSAPMPAAWQDQSGQLPGMKSGGQIAKEIGLIAGAAAGATVIYMKFLRNRGPGELGLSASDIHFGSISRTSPKTHEIGVTNKSTSLSTIQAIEVTGDSFALASEPRTPVSVKPGETYRFEVMFKPLEDRKYKGQVTIRALVSGKGGARTLAVGLEGQGMPRTIAVAPAKAAVLAASQK